MHQTFNRLTLVASGVGVPLEARPTGADGPVIDDVAVGVLAAVARRDAAGVEARSVAGALVVRSAAHGGRVGYCRRKSWD